MWPLFGYLRADPSCDEMPLLPFIEVRSDPRSYPVNGSEVLWRKCSDAVGLGHASVRRCHSMRR